MKKLSVVLIGAGNRGETYTDIMHDLSEQYEVVAVAEPIQSRREHVQQLHGIPENRCFLSYEPLFALGKIADVAVIATQDRMHLEPALMAISLGYDLLLEKPISPDAKDCVQIAKAADEHHVRVVICTVLRYTPIFGMLRKLIADGRIGHVMSINHEECVGNVHQSHSFVRGNWGNEERSSCMLLQKSCHDLDLLPWLIGQRCVKIQSFGTLSHFTRDNMPAGAPARCIDGCPHGETCPYNAVKLYLDDKDNYWFRSTSTRKQDPTDADVEETLRTTQYGQCVYQCDNDVVDHQTVNMLMEDGSTITFSMNAFNKGGRFIHIMGTKGEIHAALTEESSVRIYDFETKKEEIIPINGSDGLTSGHGGGDTGIVQCLHQYLTTDEIPIEIPTIDESCEHHLMVFAAEESRHTGTIVDMDEFHRKLL